MEIAISKEFLNGELTITNKKLAAATKSIANSFKAGQKAVVAIGKELQKIRDEELYKDDFTDGDGEPSFSMYCECVLGISKTTAYKLIGITEKFLLPEADKEEKILSLFSESALVEMSPLKTYENALTFCENYDICELTPVSDIRKYVKAVTKEGLNTLEDFVAREDEKYHEEVENSVECVKMSKKEIIGRLKEALTDNESLVHTFNCAGLGEVAENILHYC